MIKTTVRDDIRGHIDKVPAFDQRRIDLNVLSVRTQDVMHGRVVNDPMTCSVGVDLAGRDTRFVAVGNLHAEAGQRLKPCVHACLNVRARRIPGLCGTGERLKHSGHAWISLGDCQTEFVPLLVRFDRYVLLTLGSFLCQKAAYKATDRRVKVDSFSHLVFLWLVGMIAGYASVTGVTGAGAMGRPYPSRGRSSTTNGLTCTLIDAPLYAAYSF